MNYKYLPLFLSPLIFSVNASGQELANLLTTVVDAKAIKKVQPKYPISEAKAGREGWVRLSFIVEPDGTTSNLVVEESSGSRKFEKETINAVKKWKYQPATENGEAIQQCKNSVQMDYKFAGKERGVTRRFLNKYKILTDAIAENDHEKADKFANSIISYKLFTSTEEYYRQIILSDYYLFKGDKQQALSKLDSASHFIGSYSFFKRLKNEGDVSSLGMKVDDALPEKTEEKRKAWQIKEDKKKKDILYPLLHKKLVLALELNSTSEALDANEKILLIAPEDKKPLYEQQLATIKAAITDNQAILTAGQISGREVWTHRLLRNNFTFKNIAGELRKMDVRCRNKRHVYSIAEGSQWSIPASWQACSIMVYGDQGTKFTLVEMNENKSKGIIEEVNEQSSSSE